MDDVYVEPWGITKEQLDATLRAHRRRARRLAWYFAVVLMGAAGAFGAAAVFVERPDGSPSTSPMLLLAGFTVLAACITPAVVMATHRAHSARWVQRQGEYEAFTAVVDDQGTGGRTLGQLLLFNFRLMDRFSATALGQARVSFVACLMAAGATLVVLLTGSATVLAAGTTSVQVTSGALTAVGTALSGYLSFTFLKTYEMTSRQMSYYYGQPLVHCYLLHAEWLAERAGGDDATGSVNRELITASLELGRAAQDHLLELQEKVQQRPRTEEPVPVGS
ncbi:hypothetical protein ACFO1B_42160 [Dactylosporangium siamense]|uniref:Cyanobacterial TRADD-N associated 2 transmembrane domain-containing protein n=1 Tax=Dactylosporangium siamense TaxID=685454 RepID=A0A919UD33_9ACTN|nr:hypothetical protein [Dactylosporangium siamense]GIG51027.1 hypothetical protein Dsi01nite_090680 [Dactylosporangium siamense]